MAKSSRKKRITAVAERLASCSREDVMLFTWLCAIRSLPFIEWSGTFNYWPNKERQKFLMSVLKGVDAVAFATYDDAQAVADYAAIDVYNAIAALEPYNGDIYDTTIYNTLHIIASAACYAAGISDNGDTADKNVADNTAYGLHVNMESTLLQDIDRLVAGERTFEVDVSIYGDSWDNFQVALRGLGCAYWADWYAALFAKGLNLDGMSRTEIDKRLSVPHSIVAKGAAAISQYMIVSPTQEAPQRAVFFSFQSADKDLVDIIGTVLKGHSIAASRFDHDVRYKGSFKAFMQSIGHHDHVIMLISDNFLKSQACMYEVGELVSTRSLESKLLFLVVQDEDSKYYNLTPTKPVGANIYDLIKRNEYITYWENRSSEVEDSINQIRSSSAKIEPLETLREIKKIIEQDIGPFLKYLSDAKGKSFGEMHETSFEDILAKIKQTH